LNGEELKRSQKRIITIGETNLINKDSGGEREKPLQKKKKERKKEKKIMNEPLPCVNEQLKFLDLIS
jgi:hypothetical protein